MRSDRLLVLAAFLDTLPPEKLDMGVWAEKQKCGTVACAVGWACQIPEFQEAGLRVEWDKDECAVPVFGVVCGWATPAVFFGLPITCVHYLFDSELYEANAAVSPRTVAARIRDFVASGGTVP